MKDEKMHQNNHNMKSQKFGKTIDETEELTTEELVFLYHFRTIDPVQELAQKYTPLILSIAGKYHIIGYDKHDLVQEGYELFCKQLHKYDPSSGVTLGQYFKVSMHNRMKSLLRKEMAQKRTIDRIAESLESFSNEDGRSYWEEKIANDDIAPDIQTILKEKYSAYKMTLSPFESQAYTLYLIGKNIYDSALQLNASPVSVRNALSRCRNKLKNIIS